MHTEIEAKFLSIDHDAMRVRLKEIGATLQEPERLMRRKNFNVVSSASVSGDQRSWVRIRDEGDKVTMTYKRLNDRTLHGTKEINVVVDSFEQTDALLAAAGLQAKTYQETKRESWKLGAVEIELDQWPWIHPFLEIEGPSEHEVKSTAEKLGLSWDDALHGSVEIAYRAEYDVLDEEINTIPVITFDDPVPTMLEAKRR
jgi:adenylate cyclase class 2